MKPPKNFYSNLDRRKQGLPEVPEASAADAGKVVKVSRDGEYELGVNEGLPAVTSNDNGSIISVTDGAWALNRFSANRIITTGSDRSPSSSITVDFVLKKRSNSITYSLYGRSVNSDSANVYLVYGGNCTVIIDDEGFISKGFNIGESESVRSFIVMNSRGVEYIRYSGGNITYEPIGSVKYYEIESSGSSVSLPSGVTFAEVYALLQAGVDVKFTSGARVYSVTSFESTNIRAHWMCDLDLTSMEVYVINIASDGTGTVASATFSGS